jgi:hypothetical protein
MKNDWLKKMWKDPVMSKVIAAAIIFILSQIFIFIGGLIAQLNFIQVYIKIFNFFNTNYLVNGWVLGILITLLVVFLLIILFRLKNPVKGLQILNEKELETDKTEETEEPQETEIRTEPTVFFHHRLCDAFPGFSHGYQEFKSQRDIRNRLKILLAPPLTFDKGEGHGIDRTPIWWFRGGSALHVKRFEILNRQKVLFNYDELIIEKIVAFRGYSYYQDFVYVQCKADKATGLYEHNQLTLEKYFDEGGEYQEEFAIFRNKFISRQDYDDGSTIINGKPIKTIGAELRCRTLIKYNFIICAKFAPYNCHEFSATSKEYFMNLLKNQITFDEFAKWMNKFPKNHNDD